MSAWQEWMNRLALDFLTAVWQLFSAVAFWVCAVGMAVFYLIYVVTKDRKSFAWCFKLFMGYLLLMMVKAAIP